MSKKLVSWNVNGLRACVSKGEFQKFIDEEKPDVIGLQEQLSPRIWQTVL